MTIDLEDLAAGSSDTLVEKAESKILESQKDDQIEPQRVVGKQQGLSTRLAVVGIFSALALAIGYAFAFIPNVELFTMTIFLAGFLFGKRIGASVGAIASVLFTYFNPLGASQPLLYGTQITLYTLLGLLGGVFRGKKLLSEIQVDTKTVLLLAAIGATFILVFDFLATFAQYTPYIGFSLEALVPYLIMGIPYTLVHVISNIFAFCCLIPVIVSALQPLRIPVVEIPACLPK